MLPVSGVGARISGSMPVGGHSTPSDFASLSPSGSARYPVVVPSGATVPRGGTGCIGAQLSAEAGGAVWAGGVAGSGGACAPAISTEAISTLKNKRESSIRIQGNNPGVRLFPKKPARKTRGFAALRLPARSRTSDSRPARRRGSVHRRSVIGDGHHDCDNQASRDRVRFLPQCRAWRAAA